MYLEGPALHAHPMRHDIASLFSGAGQLGRALAHVEAGDPSQDLATSTV